MIKTKILNGTNQKTNALTLLAVIVISMITANSRMGGYYAFTNVAVSALCGNWGVFSLLASIATYLLNGTYSQNIVQITSIIAIVSLKLLAKKKIKTITNCLLTVFSVLACSVVSVIVQRTDITLIIFRLVSAVFCGCLVFITTELYDSFKRAHKIQIKGLNGVYVLFMYILSITTLCSLSLFSLNLGRTAGILSLLMFSKKYGIKGGGILGGIFTFSVIMFSPVFAKNILYITASSVLAGSLSVFGNIPMAIAFIFSSVIGLATVGFNSDTFMILTDISWACIIFIVLPCEIQNRLLSLFIHKDTKNSNLKNTSLNFVNMPNQALNDIKKRIDEISKTLPQCDKLNVNNIENISLMRNLLSQQLSVTCDLLTDIENNIAENSQLDFNLSKRCEGLCVKFGITPQKVTVFQHNDSRVVELFLKSEPSADMIKFTVELSEIVECDLEMPNIIKIGNLYKLSFSKYSNYKLSNYLIQKNIENEEVCGDTVERIWLSSDKFLVILSDGMGTGKGAKLDSAFATSLILRLISSGTSAQTAIKLSNSIMRVKGWNESFATVDIGIFDLYKGEVSFIKSGASPSYILRDGNIIKIECDSFPIGILPETTFTLNTYKLFENDYVIVCSDGVIEQAVLKSSKEIEKNSFSSQQTAEIITELTKQLREKDQRDDISVFVSRVSMR